MTDINLPAVLVSDGVASVLALTVLCSRFRKPRIKSFDDTVFFLMTLLVAFLPVLEGITFVLDGCGIFRGNSAVCYFECCSVCAYFCCNGIMGTVYRL